MRPVLSSLSSKKVRCVVAGVQMPGAGQSGWYTKYIGTTYGWLSSEQPSLPSETLARNAPHSFSVISLITIVPLPCYPKDIYIGPPGSRLSKNVFHATARNALRPETRWLAFMLPEARLGATLAPRVTAVPAAREHGTQYPRLVRPT